MSTRDSFPDGALDEAARAIANGATRESAVSQFMSEWSLPLQEAERLYREAWRTSTGRFMTAEGTKDILWGFGAFAVGGLVTGITYVVAPPGGTYFFLWGPMIYGAYKLFKGFSVKFRTVAEKRDIYPWLAAAVVFAVGVVIASVVTLNAGRIADPLETDLDWNEAEPLFLDPNTMVFTGEISNHNSDWTISAVTMRLNLYDAAGVFLRREVLDLSLPGIAPTDSEAYSVSVQVPDAAEQYDTEIAWEWVIE